MGMTDLELCLFGALACLPQVVGRLEALERRVRRASSAEIAEAGSCGLGSVGFVGTSGKETELTGARFFANQFLNLAWIKGSFDLPHINRL
jgi:hypothetical protein